MESNPGSNGPSSSSRHPLSDRDDELPSQSGQRLEQLCLGIVQFLRTDTSASDAAFPHAISSIRAETERQVVPLLETALRSVTSKMRQELMTWLRMVENLEQLGNNAQTQSVGLTSQAAESQERLPSSRLTIVPPPRTSPTMPEFKVPPPSEIIVPQDPEDLYLPGEEETNGSSLDFSCAAAAPAGADSESAKPAHAFAPDTSGDRIAYLLQEAEQLAERGYHARALVCCDKAIKLDPDSPAPLSRRGKIHFLRGDADRALNDLTAAIHLGADDAEVYLFRGNVWVEKGEFPQAIRDYTNALKWDPQSSVAYENRAWVRAKQLDWPEVIKDACSALKLDPGSSESLFIRGSAYVNLGRNREALADLTELLEQNSDHALGYNERGKVNARLHRYEQALADYEAALHLNPELVTAGYNRALVLSELGQIDAALEAFNELIESMPGNAILHYQRGRIQIARDNPIEAIEDLKAALEIKPRFPEATTSLREARNLLEQPVEASPAVAETLPERPKVVKELEETRQITNALAPVGAKPSSQTKPETRTGGLIEITCKGCGASRQIPFDKLNRQYQCQSCRRIFYVAQSGTVAEVKAKKKSTWELFRSNVRWPAAAVLFIALLLTARYAWHRTMGKDGSTLPNELEPRVQMLAKAWVQDDPVLMRRLTQPPQGRRLKDWLKDHPCPLSPQDREISSKRDQTSIDLQVADEKRDAVQIVLTVSHPLMAKSIQLKQLWVREGESWFFKPFPKDSETAFKDQFVHE